MKRQGNDRQLRPEEVEAMEDESEDAGTYSRADAGTLSTRRIVKVKRSSSTLDGHNESLPKTSMNPFAGVNLMKSTNNTMQATSINSFTGQNLQNTQITQDNVKLKQKMKKLNDNFLSFMESNLNSNWKEGLQDYIKYATELIETYGADEEVEDDQSSSSSILSSIRTGPKEDHSFDPLCSNNLSRPESAITSSSTPATLPLFTATGPQTSSSLFSFQPPVASAATATVPASVPLVPPASTVSGSSLGGNQPAQTFPLFSFAPPGPAKAATLPTFTFAPVAAPSALPTVAAPSALPAFTFNQPFMLAPSITNPFAFTSAPNGNAATASGGTSAGNGNDSDDEGEPIMEAEKILKNENDTDVVLYETNCKLFRYDNETKEWNDAGKGVLKITRDGDSKKQRILIRDPMGKLSLNCYFYSGMKFDKIKTDKIRFLAPSGDTSGEFKSLLVKLKADEADKTLEKLREGVEAMS